jgi:hypothetical protein
MYFKQFLDERCGCASYLIASRQSHEAAIIDPSIAIEEYETLLAQRGFHLRYAIVSSPSTGAICVSTKRPRSRIRSVRFMTARIWRWGNCGCACCTHRATDPSWFPSWL